MSNFYEVAIIGGGPAGLTTALYTSRLEHSTIVFDKGGGRCAMMADTHNVLGITEDTSGVELLQTGEDQVEQHGGTIVKEPVVEVEQLSENRFAVSSPERTIEAKRVVLATGFTDEHPPAPAPRTARGLHYCLHCDAQMFVDEPVYVMGHTDSAAKVALIMLNFTDDVDILTRTEEPQWSRTLQSQLEEENIDVIADQVTGITNNDEGWLESIEFEDGRQENYKGGFAMYGSNYNTDLAESLGCKLTEDGEVAVGSHGETSVDGVYAVGDVTPGHNQIPVRMGQGAKTGIQLHYELRTYPKE